MTNNTAPVLPKWPFFLGDVVLIGAAVVAVMRLGAHPSNLYLNLLCVGILAGGGAVLAVFPFVLEYKAALKFTETDRLADTLGQIQQLGQVGAQIAHATSQWQDVSIAAGKTAGTAREIAERMTAEVAGFADFMKKANDSEKAALRLEVEKARRSEGEWLQIVVRILDHIFALHQAAARSGQPELLEQLTNFQNACREVARRIGLIPYTALFGEPFDAERHRLLDAETAPVGAVVAETVATGFNYQGRPLRPALVKLQDTAAAVAVPEEPAPEADEPSFL